MSALEEVNQGGKGGTFTLKAYGPEETPLIERIERVLKANDESVHGPGRCGHLAALIFDELRESLMGEAERLREVLTLSLDMIERLSWRLDANADRRREVAALLVSGRVALRRDA